MIYELIPQAVQGLVASAIIVFILVVWNDTNAFVEYARTFLGGSFEKYKPHENDGLMYVDYLELAYSSNFLVRLICCPICLGVWLSAAAAFYLESFYIFFLIFYISVFAYFKFKKAMNGD
tara:strand:- start:7109 stop:7468 length:360 start_codon:yes stop_codon:yes gene_type:complete